MLLLFRYILLQKGNEECPVPVFGKIVGEDCGVFQCYFLFLRGENKNIGQL